MVATLALLAGVGSSPVQRMAFSFACQLAVGSGVVADHAPGPMTMGKKTRKRAESLPNSSNYIRSDRTRKAYDCGDEHAHSVAGHASVAAPNKS
jgi:hypothetical protein